MSKSKFYNQIGEALKDLPGETAHLMMFPKRKGAESIKSEGISYRKAGVMILLHFSKDQYWITLTQRHDYDGAHGGQVSLPGGAMEENDASILHTALRETEEEIGIKSSDIQLIGELSELYIPVSNFMVYPFIGYVDHPPTYIRQESEVSEIFHFAIKELVDDESIYLRDVKANAKLVLKNIPSFVHEDKTIWGATALILNEFREILRREKIRT